MAEMWMDVDTALGEVPVNIMPLTDDTDFKSIEGAIAYNAAGMALRWHFVTTTGAYTVTSVTPTTGGAYDWTDQGDSGIYTIEIPASGGASINNDTEGFGWFTGVCTGVLPWRGPVIGFRAAALNDALIDGGDLLDVSVTQISGAAVSTTTAQLGVNIVQISADATAADNLESYCDGTTPIPANATQISGDATAADNAEAFFDGTGYAGTNNVIPTVTTVTNLHASAATAAELAKVPKSDSTVTWNATALASINAEVDTALNTAIPGSPTANSINERIATMDGLLLGTVAAGTHNPQSGDAYARLGAPAGASVSADVAAVADAVWDEAISGHLTAGSTGNALNAAGSAGDPWSTPLPGAYGAGTAGKIVGDNINAPIATVDTVVDGIASILTDIHGTDLPAVKADTAAILLDTGTDGVVIPQAQADKVWGTAARTLTAGTNIALAKGTGVTGFNDVSSADVSAACDTAISDAALATAAAVAALNNLSSAQAQTAAAAAITAAALATSAQVAAIPVQAKKNTALANFAFFMTDSTNHEMASGKTVTVTRRIDSGTHAAGSLSAVTEVGNGEYRVDFAAADLNGDVITLRATATGCDDTFVTIVTAK